MNYYERHLGDYARDTAHLSMLEHGAYGLLLDRYYATEMPITADQAQRLARARSKEERQAVDDVLAEFFKLVDGAWVNARAQLEVAKKESKTKAAQTNGRNGGRPKKNKLGYENLTHEKPTGLFLGYEIETQEKAHQSPVTSNQEIPPIPPSGADAGFISEKPKPTAVAFTTWMESVKASGEKPIPEDDPVFSYANQVGIPHEHLRLCWREFRERYSQSGAKRYRDWRTVFRKAVRGNWLKLWWIDADGTYSLTTCGKQAEKAAT